MEPLRLEDLLVEPRLDFVLLGFGEFLVGVVEVTIELQQRDLRKGGARGRIRISFCHDT